MTNIPIFFVHRGNSRYLPYSLLQAKASNPDAPRYLLGDSQNSHYKNIITHVDSGDYSEDAKAFEAIYQHLSPNPYHMELYCFQRWFILRSFMRANHLTQCLYVDSDLMVYGDMTEAQKQFQDDDLTLANGLGPHNCFINNFEVLDNLCNFMMSMYTDLELLEAIHFQVKQALDVHQMSGGICDMVAFDAYTQRKLCNVGEIFQITAGSIFDNNISFSEGFQMNDMLNIKAIHFKQDHPYGYLIESNEEVRFQTLHFQGDRKRYMKRFYRGSKLGLAKLKFEDRVLIPLLNGL
jgi:hypothetical protein